MPDILQLKIAIKDTKPAIWRTIQVEETITFFELHHIIQITMGWKNYHLFEFKAHKYRIGIEAEPEFYKESKIVDANTVTLGSLLESKEKFEYTYDFGDDWFHEIKVEKFLPDDGSVNYPICIDGALSCPPEDCGGTHGFRNLLTILKDPKHPEHKDMKKWVGKDYDPNKFDIGKINKELSNLKGYIKKWNSLNG